METITPISSKINKSILFLTTILGFILLGLSYNITGPAMPFIKQEFSFGEFQLGLLFALNALGYLLACNFTSVLTNNIGIKFTSILSLLLMILSGILIYCSPGLSTFAASYLILYMGTGILEISLGILTSLLFSKNIGKMMNIFNCIYGFSSIVAPILTLDLMNNTTATKLDGWRGVFILILLLCLISLFMLLTVKLPNHIESPEIKVSFRNFSPNKTFCLLVSILSFGMLCQSSVSCWLVIFLNKSYDYSLNKASFTLSVFFACFTLGRLLLNLITKKIGLTKSLFIFSCFSGIAIISGVFMGKANVILLVIAGFGIGPIYPIVSHLILRIFNNKNSAISYALTTMSIILVFGNLFIGFLTEVCKNIFTIRYGIEAGIALGYMSTFIFIGICSLICSLLTLLLMKKLKNINSLC